MTRDDVFKVMGTPDASEGFDWGVAWIYRTGMARVNFERCSRPKFHSCSF